MCGALIAKAYVGQRDTKWFIPRRCQAVVRVRKITAIIYRRYRQSHDCSAFYFCHPCHDPDKSPQSHRRHREKKRERHREGERE
jgi:hypothetical protein